MSLDGVELKYLETTEEAGEFMTWLGQRRPVLGFDTETGGLRWWDQDLRLVQFGDRNTGWVMSYRDWRGVVVEALTRYEEPITAHNMPFDAKFGTREGLPLKRHLWHDTLPMHHLLNPPASHALKPISEEIVDPYAHAGAVALHDGMAKQKWGWDTVPLSFAPYIWYSALDGVLAARVWEELYPQIVSGGFLPSYELELANLWDTGVDAAMRGLLVDTEYAREAQAFVRERADRTKSAATAEYGISLGSTKAVTDVLERAGVPLTEVTDSGNWKLDKAVLSDLAGAHPLIDMVTQYRNDVKFARAYYGNVLDRVTSEGYIYPDINCLGARTGRASVSKPALQQIPSTDWRPRRMFIPESGNVFVSVDLSNIEVRLLAHFSQDPTMLAAFREGRDVHSMMARKMYPRETEHLTDEEMADSPYRKKSKSGSLGKQYGIGVRKFAQQQKVPESEAQAFLDYYAATFPAVISFIDDVCAIAEKRYREEGLAYIKDPGGRVHTLTRQEARNGEWYKLVNYLIQGYAATLLKRATVRFAATRFGYTYRLPVHDELLLSVPEEDAMEAAETLRECMVTCDDGKLTVPLAADIEIYRESWGESVKGFKTEMAPR